MSVDHQIFARPIEITATSKAFTVNDGSGAVAKYLTEGVYPCILTVVSHISEMAAAVDADFSFVFTDGTETGNGGAPGEFYVAAKNADAAKTMTIAWTHSALRDLLGFTGDFAVSPAEDYEYAANRPKYCWFPTYPSYDRQRFTRDQSRFAGVEGMSGRLAGIQTGPNIYRRTFSFAMEPHLNLFYGSEATTDISEQRCLEDFLLYSRTASATSSTNPSPKGFYYIPNRDYYTRTGGGAVLPQTMDSGGVRFDRTYSPNKYVFCMLDSKDIPAPDNALPVGTSRYNVSFSVHTATAPSFYDHT